MSDTIIAVLISGGISILVTVITVISSNRKITAELKTEIAVLDERIKSQKESIDKHNNFGSRIPVLEEKAQSIEHRIEVIEEHERNIA